MDIMMTTKLKGKEVGYSNQTMMMHIFICVRWSRRPDLRRCDTNQENMLSYRYVNTGAVTSCDILPRARVNKNMADEWLGNPQWRQKNQAYRRDQNPMGKRDSMRLSQHQCISLMWVERKFLRDCDIRTTIRWLCVHRIGQGVFINTLLSISNSSNSLYTPRFTSH